MTLDIHIGPDKDAASRVVRVAVFNEVLHRQVFHRPFLLGEECPLLRRMVSYSADAFYLCEELRSLIAEIDSLKGRGSPVIAEQLGLIADAAGMAGREGCNLYIFCD
jgi:hypothetical protein